jgi:hypothetical protein
MFAEEVAANMNMTVLNCLSPAGLLVVWFVVFVVLTDFNCPPFFTYCVCPHLRGRRKCGRGPER